jgi:hypothetical protein
MHLDVTCPDPAKSEARPVSREKKNRSKKRFDEAQQYISDFGIEGVLSDAMREVIRDKPDDPFRYLSNRILQFGDTMAVKYDRTMRPQESDFGATALTSPYGATALTSPLSAAPIVRIPKVVAIMPFKAYYQANFRGANVCGTVCMGRFPGYTPPKPQAVAPVKSLLPFRAYWKANFRGANVCATVCMGRFPGYSPPKPPAIAAVKSLAPFKAYWKANCKGANLVESQARRLFPAKPKSRPAGAPQPVTAATTPAAASSQALVVVKPTFTLKPSVGTWCAAKPFLPNLAATYLYKPSHMLASVGTWLAPAPVEEAHEFGPPNFIKLPSVGTWLQPRLEGASTSTQAKAASQEAELNFVNRPSVGTWLTRTPPKVQKPWFFEPVEKGEHKELIRGLQQVISDKDVELERLKAQIAALTGGGVSVAQKAPRSADELRETAKCSLAAAAESGALATGMQGVAKTVKEDTEVLRKKGKESLSAASGNGVLTGACQKARA